MQLGSRTAHQDSGSTGAEHAGRGFSRRSFLRLAVGAGAGVVVAQLNPLRMFTPATEAAAAQPLAAASPLPVTSAPATAPPNVLLVTIDTLRADQLGSYGHPYVKTPALDAVAAAGVRFARHISQEPQTAPSHGSIFSGMYPSSNGLRTNVVDKLPARIETMATLLAGAGYQTAGLFSWPLFQQQYSGLQRGFQVYRDFSEPAAAGVDVFDLAARKPHGQRVTDAAIAQLSAFSADAPYFMWLHYLDPHYPYQPPGEYARLYDPTYQGPVDGSLKTISDIERGSLKPTGDSLKRLLSLYQGEISYVDGQVGRVIDELDRTDQARRTVVAITADHGESMGEHSDLTKHGNFFHPKSLFDAEVHVPLLLRYPDKLRAGSTVQSTTQGVDLLPTFLEFAGVPAPAQAQGASLLRLLDGTESGPDRAAFSSMPDYVFTSVATAGWKLIRNNANGGRRLFDVAADPIEQHDLLAARPDMARSLTDMLERWMRSAKVS